ncbi:MAG TPA: transcription regulator [Rhodocyclaceae bacterium]|nr:transcription regulator [Rhodocyclaceae bacterium]
MRPLPHGDSLRSSQRDSLRSQKNPGNATLPPYATESRWYQRLLYEIWDHLWPWSRHGFAGRHFLFALSFGAAALVFVVWLLAAAGRIGPAVVIAWWVGWSVFEVSIRRQSKPYIKDGPWWGKTYRPADLADMICYVTFKNVLIGAALFVSLRLIGVLDFLQRLPGLQWLYS